MNSQAQWKSEGHDGEKIFQRYIELHFACSMKKKIFMLYFFFSMRTKLGKVVDASWRSMCYLQRLENVWTILRSIMFNEIYISGGI